jgi:hypothetical protein
MLASKGTVGADDAVAPMPGVIEKISRKCNIINVYFINIVSCLLK